VIAAFVVQSVVLAVCVAVLAWRAVEDRRERLMLVNRIIGRNPGEVSLLDRAVAAPPKREEREEREPREPVWETVGERPVGA
jgi:hypothetical protein